MNEKYQPTSEDTENAENEANQFNKMVDKRQIGAEYLSLLLKEQTPEQVQEIVRAAEKHVRNINAFGELAHGNNAIDYGTFQNIIQDGLKSFLDVKRETGKEPGVFTLYPDGISCGMNGVGFSLNEDAGIKHNDASTYGVNHPQELEKNVSQQFKSKFIPLTFIINPNFVRDSLEHIPDLPKDQQQDPILFVGSEFFHIQIFQKHMEDFQKSVKKLEETQEGFPARLIEYCKKVGWVDAAIKSKKANSPGDFLLTAACPNYDAFYGEVVISNRYKNLTNERMVDGIVIPANYSKQTAQWLSTLAIKDPRSAIPLYDIDGNLIWPVRMSSDEVKNFADKKNNAIAKPD